MEIKKLFGKNLRARRRLLDLTQESLAEKTGMTRAFISGIERGKRNPSLETMNRLANELGVHVSFLLRLEE